MFCVKTDDFCCCLLSGPVVTKYMFALYAVYYSVRRGIYLYDNEFTCIIFIGYRGWLVLDEFL